MDMTDLSLDFEKKLVAYCGIYCRNCDYYTGKIAKIGKQALDLVKKHTEFKIIAEQDEAFNYDDFIKGVEWLANIKLCLNCRAGDGWGGCPIRKCALEKGVDYCFECSEFPCKTLEDVSPKVVARLQEIKDKGLENWLKEQLQMQ